MVQKFAYFYEQILMQYKSLQIRKKSNSSVLEPILRNFHTKFLASDILTVPSEFYKTCLGPSYGPKPVEKRNSENRSWDTFTQQKSKIILSGEFLDLYPPLVQVSRESGSGGGGCLTRPYTRVLYIGFLIFGFYCTSKNLLVKESLLVKVRQQVKKDLVKNVVISNEAGLIKL